MMSEADKRIGVLVDSLRGTLNRKTVFMFPCSRGRRYSVVVWTLPIQIPMIHAKRNIRLDEK